MAASKPMLGDIELQQVEKIEVDEDQVLAQQSVPALEGDFLQRLGRRGTQISLTGVLTGAEAGAGLKTLQEKFRAAAPISFIADIATATKVEKVLIEEMGIRELAGKPARFEYALTLREFTPPLAPEPVPPPPPPPPPPSVETGTLVVDVTVEGQPDFDFSKVTVSAEGTQDDGTSLTRTLTNRSNNSWTEEKMPPGKYTAKAVVTDPRSLSGAATVTVSAGQTAKASITLQSGSLIAKAFVVHFWFDKAFVEPCMLEVLKTVVTYANAHADEKLVIVGHTDLVGDSTYNQSLSERRGRSVYAALSYGRDKATALAEWNALRQPTDGALPSIKDSWGVREYQYMLQDLDFYSGNIDGVQGPETDAAVRDFQKSKGLTVDGIVGDQTWSALIEAYLDQYNLTILETQFLPNCGGEILKWLGCGEQDPVKNTQDAWRRNRRTELLFVKASTMPCQVPQPETFDLPAAGAVGSKWCLGPGDKNQRNCFVTRKTPQQGKWLIQPVEPDTITVSGSITFDDGTPASNMKYVLIAPDGEYMDGEILRGADHGKPIPHRTNDDGTFAYPDKTKGVGIYTMEVIAPVVVRTADEPPQDAKGNVVCKRLDTTTVGETKPQATATGKLSGLPTVVSAAPAKGPKVNPHITLASPVVVVKKSYMNPARQAITLRCNTPFVGKATLTRSSAPIRFFKAFAGGTEITFNGADNLFTDAELTAPDGVKIFAEGATASTKLNDVTLTLTLNPGSPPAGGTPPPVGPPATVTMTSVEVQLDIAQKRTTPGVDPPLLSTNDKINKGRFLRVQDAGNDSTRSMLVVHKALPAAFDGELVLTRLNDQVQVFNTAQETATAGQTPLANPFVIKNSAIPASGLKLWVEGVKKSSTERETGIQLGINGVESGGDKVMITVMPNMKIKGNLFWNRTWDYNTAPKLPATASIPPVKEFLPGAKVEIYIQRPGVTVLSLFKTVFLSDGAKVIDPHGAFEVTDVPETPRLAMRVLLEFKDGKVVVVKGKSSAVNDADFKIQTGMVIWHQFDLNISAWNEKTIEFDHKDVEITRVHFIDICDAYKSIWFGHHRLLELATYNPRLCTVNYPEPTSSTTHHENGQLFVLKDDLKDRAVLLHEYGHFVNREIGMSPPNPGYLYNDIPGHDRGSKEHYEAAWREGAATFFSCALRDDPIYHDGYDADLTYHLDTDNTTIGPHSEGSIQEALWRIYKVHGTNFKDGFWKAYTDSSRRSLLNSAFDFFQNWKDLGIADLDKLLEAFKKFNMEFGYKYRSGGDMFTAVGAPKTFNLATQEFRTIDELFTHFGTLGGGTLADYKEEFYNRNKFFNDGTLAAGSTPADPKITIGTKYIVPERIQVTL